jgi:site-specific recombinase XerC
MEESAMPSSEDHATEEARALLREYEQFLSGKAEGTREAYLRTVRHLSGWFAQLPGNAGKFQPRQLTQEAVELYLTHLEQEGLSLNHRARVKSTISNFAQFLIEEKGLLQRNPTRGIDLPTAPLLAPRQLSQEQRLILHSLVAQAADRRGAALFALGYWAGLRVSDISWLRMVDTHVGPEDGWLHVESTESKWRDIDLLSQAHKQLYEYLQATQGTARIYVFFSQRSARLTAEGIYYWFRTLKAQGTKVQTEAIQDIAFHDLRYDFAARAREGSWSREEVTYYLGDVTKGMAALQSTERPAQEIREQVKHKFNNMKE